MSIESNAKKMGHNIRRLREIRGLTQEQLGKLAGTSHVTIGNIERGDTSTKMGILTAIAKALGAPLQSLIEEDEINPDPEFAALNPIAQRIVRLLPYLDIDDLKIVLTTVERFAELGSFTLSLDTGKKPKA